MLGYLLDLLKLRQIKYFNVFKSRSQQSLIFISLFYLLKSAKAAKWVSVICKLCIPLYLISYSNDTGNTNWIRMTATNEWIIMDSSATTVKKTQRDSDDNIIIIREKLKTLRPSALTVILKVKKKRSEKRWGSSGRAKWKVMSLFSLTYWFKRPVLTSHSFHQGKNQCSELKSLILQIFGIWKHTI